MLKFFVDRGTDKRSNKQTGQKLYDPNLLICGYNKMFSLIFHLYIYTLELFSPA